MYNNSPCLFNYTYNCNVMQAFYINIPSIELRATQEITHLRLMVSILFSIIRLTELRLPQEITPS